MVWKRTFGDEPGFSAGRSVIVAPDGGYVVAGWISSDICLLKISESGEIVWEKTYGGAGGDYGYSVAATPDGGYVITGATWSFGDGKFAYVYLLKVDGFGNLLWEKIVGGDMRDHGYSVAVAPDGGYIIGAITLSFDVGGIDFYLIKTDANGNL